MLSPFVVADALDLRGRVFSPSSRYASALWDTFAFIGPPALCGGPGTLRWFEYLETAREDPRRGPRMDPRVHLFLLSRTPALSAAGGKCSRAIFYVLRGRLVTSLPRSAGPGISALARHARA